MNKRFYKELQSIIIQQNSKPLLENDYLIYFDEGDMSCVYALIKGNYDSVYRHKFILLKIDISKEYPFVPPSVTFINHDNTRIHPTLYEDGRTCSTILNTWPSENEKWSSSFGIETILLTFQSFLDYNPYTYEPGGKDDSSYTDYVLHQTWYTCLLKYLYDENMPKIFIDYMNSYILINISNIFKDLKYFYTKYPEGIYFTKCFYIENYTIDYINIIYLIENYYNDCITFDDAILFKDNDNINHINNINMDSDYKCCICFDTLNDNEYIKLECGHSFHTYCIKRHILHNNQVCSLCRTSTVVNEWLVNPLTNKKIKIDSLTFKKLKADGII
jgi:ubiquitin-conjugating enzyme E2 Z